MTETTDIQGFVPPVWLRSPVVQSALASAKFRKRGATDLEGAAQYHLLTGGSGARTSCLLSCHPQSRGLVVILHGWLGSVQSAYVVSTAKFLFRQGFSVCRVNLLEHGDSVTLNPGFHHAAEDADLFDAIAAATGLTDDETVSLIGYSLGGNFALRVARRLRTQPIPKLRHVFAISPVIDPVTSSPMIDAHPLMRAYFTRKLRRWLREKTEAFPDLYQAGAIAKKNSVLGMSHDIICGWTEFETLDDYFRAYRLMPEEFEGCPAKLTLFGAFDDPVVSGSDIAAMAGRDMEVIMSPFGGHNGFFDAVRGPTFYERAILNSLSSAI
ncbi:alpha/beta fold hydrolase [Falsiruegeria mediterranea]|uniref:2-succinyl-6-hydroxy-2, 4-cyclohexadiene-1-carboxylate synthase n=1 Tax=Falsiruegeria mediterranea M17 TaxID=1200281 RepID=A0A2R8CDW2_9RHOB|nr:alpha/beta fold hydrolase [Falsiruegeria mediterranea]SPJ30569.1 2-succinyl-6-hydroxy-2, 4-cyclohexadiene-1-carboxylate synthase [Falsiruegeria mediterranea M17]